MACMLLFPVFFSGSIDEMGTNCDFVSGFLLGFLCQQNTGPFRHFYAWMVYRSELSGLTSKQTSPTFPPKNDQALDWKWWTTEVKV